MNNIVNKQTIMTNVTILKEQLAFINGQIAVFEARKNDLEVLIAELEAAEVRKPYLAPSIEVTIKAVVETEVVELPAPPAEIDIDISDISQENNEDESKEIVFANRILTNRNHTEWCDGIVDMINIHLKQTPVDGNHPYPYTLWKEKIFEIDVYDSDGVYLATSPQFHIDNLGNDILRYLRTKMGFGKYEPKTYEPKDCWLCCN